MFLAHKTEFAELAWTGIFEWRSSLGPRECVRALGPPPASLPLLVPVLLLGGVIGLFLLSGRGRRDERRRPLPSRRFASSVTVLRPGREIELHLPNQPQSCPVAQVPSTNRHLPSTSAGARLPAWLGSADASIPVGRGRGIALSLFSGNASSSGGDPRRPPRPATRVNRNLAGFTSIGLEVGIFR